MSSNVGHNHDDRTTRDYNAEQQQNNNYQNRNNNNNNHHNNNYNNNGGRHGGYHGGRGGGRHGGRHHNYNRRIEAPNDESLKITRHYPVPIPAGRGGLSEPRFGRGRGGGRDGTKRISGSMVPKTEAPMPTQVKLAMKVLTTLGNYSEMTEEDDVIANIHALSNIFITVGDLKDYPAEISDIFIKCFSQLSLQTPILASLLALIHHKERDFSALVVNKLQTKLVDSLTEDDVIMSRNVLKALACLSSCEVLNLVGDGNNSLLYIFNVLYDIVVNPGSNTNVDGVYRSDVQVALYLLASTIPWVINSLIATPAGKAYLEKTFSLCEQFLASYRSPYAVGGVQAIYAALPAENEGASLLPGPGGVYDTLWESVAAAREIIAAAVSETGFVPPASMISPWTHDSIRSEIVSSADTVAPLSFDETLPASLQDIVEKRTIGSRDRNCVMAGTNTTTAVGSASATTWLKARVPIYDNETSPEATLCFESLTHTEKVLAVNYFQDILYAFDPYICPDGTRVGSVELMATHLLGVFKLYPKEAHVEYILLELLFSTLLQQPVNTIANASIYKLILTLCKMTTTDVAFPPAVALIVNILYQMIVDFDMNVTIEFSNWFAFHLINTQLNWPYWAFWESELKESLGDTSGDEMDADGNGSSTTEEIKETSNLKIFVTHFVSKLSKAVVADRLKTVLPPCFLALVPAAGTGSASINCSLFADNVATADLGPVFEGVPNAPNYAALLRDMLEQKVTPEDLVEWLEEVIAENESTAVTTTWTSSLLLQTIVHFGSVNNTLSGVTGLLDHYSIVIRTLAESDADQQALIDTLVEIYGQDTAMFSFLYDEMLRRSQITAAAAVLWCTAAARLTKLTTNTTVYLLLETVVDRSVDFVKAAIAQRSLVGGDMLLNELLDLTPEPEPEEQEQEMQTEDTNATASDSANVTMAVSTSDSAEGVVAVDTTAAVSALDTSVMSAVSATAADEEEQVDYDEDDEDGGRRQRFRRGEKDDVDTSFDTRGNTSTLEIIAPEEEGGNASASQEREERAAPVNNVWLTTETVKTSLGAIRTVYKTIVTTLVKSIVTNDGNDALFNNVAHSLLRRVLRSVHGAERNLSHNYNKVVLLSDVAANIEAYLAEVPEVLSVWRQIQATN